MLYLKRKFLLHRLMEEMKQGGDQGGGDGKGGAEGAAGSGGTAAGAGASSGAAKGGDGAAGSGGAGASGDADGSGAGAFGDWGKTVEAYDGARKGEGKLKGVLSRYSDFGAFADAHLSLQQKISKGEFRSALKADAKPEEVAKWRQENGIPESPDKYDIKLSGDRKVLKEDKAYIDAILERMHGKNANSELASATVDTYYDIMGKMRSERQAEDVKLAAATEHALRVEWGGKYEPNLNDVNTFLDMAPKDVRDRLKGGRLADGTPIIHDVATQRWLLSVARQANPVSTVVPLGTNEGMASAVEAELAAIKKDMGAKQGSDAWKAYWKDPDRQARYRELLTFQEKAKDKT